MDIEKKLANWLSSELGRNRSKDKPLRRFVLRTAAPGSKGAEIETYELDETIMLTSDDIPAYAGNILQRAQDDADGAGPTIQRYTLFSFCKGAQQPSGRFIFRLRGQSDLDLDDEAGEDAPTNKGLLQQLMRHNEATNRALMQGMTGMMGIMTRQLESVNQVNEKLIRERTDMFETLESARSTQSERDTQLMLVSGEQERKDKAFEKLMGLVPVVINRMIGAKVMPGDANDPLMLMLDPLISGMSQEQFQGITATLKPEQQLMFFEILKTIQARKNGAVKEN